MLNSAPTIETLLNHRSVRKYTGEPISDEMLQAILEAGRAVSTSSFLQATSIIRVVGAAKRTQLRQISCNMSEADYNEALANGERLGHGYVESCAEYLIFCMDAKRHNQLADVQTDWTEVTLIGAIDAALMAQNVLAAAESLGLGGVFIGSLRNDIERAGEILGCPKHVVPLFGLCLGHPDWESMFLVTTRFHFLEGNTKFLFHKIKKCGTKCITKKGIVEMLFGAPETGVANTTFRDKTMDVRIPF